MAILNKILPLTLALFLSGCYENIDLEQEGKSVLCINSLITAGKPITAEISRSWFYSDMESTQNHSVDDATLSIYANDALVDAKYSPKEGDRIRLIAESPQYGTAEAEVTVPVSTPIEKISLLTILLNSDFTFDDQYHSYQNLQAFIRFDAKVDLTIDDVRPEINYFILDVKNYSSNLRGGYVNFEMEPIFKEHIGILESVIGAESAGTTFFTDRQFANSSYTMHFNFSDFIYYIHDWRKWNEFFNDCGLRITLACISDSYYNWLNYNWQIADGFVKDFSSLGLGDPICGYSNVSTGAGIVAARSLVTYELSFSSFIKSVIEEAHPD